jgi:hypothetical protein
VTTSAGVADLPDVELHSCYVRRTEYGSGLTDELLAAAVEDLPAWLWGFLGE